jgi:cytosine/uracil/thiamine/allantoin permease
MPELEWTRTDPSLATVATLITNAVDFASRSKQPANVILPQLIALPFTFGIVSFFGSTWTPPPHVDTADTHGP